MCFFVCVCMSLVLNEATGKKENNMKKAVWLHDECLTVDNQNVKLYYTESLQNSQETAL